MMSFNAMMCLGVLFEIIGSAVFGIGTYMRRHELQIPGLCVDMVGLGVMVALTMLNF